MKSRNILLSAFFATILTIGAIASPNLMASANAIEVTASGTIASGSWTKKSFKSSGTWTIYQEDGSTFVSLSDDFKTRKAPDLKIFLSPLSASSATGRNATDGAVLISSLENNRGGQVYKIPSSVNIADFNSILIHCEAYSKLWSASDI